jgi:cell division protein FtsW
LARKLASDKLLFAALVTLSLFGCVMIYSASAVSAGETTGTPYRFLLKQLVAMLLGGAAAFAVYRIDYRALARPWVVYGAYGVSLLLCLAALFAPPINSARRWISFGGFTLQPSEFLKVSLVLVLAYQISRKAENLGDPERAALPAMVFTGAGFVTVLLQPDLGTAACYAMLCGVVLWLAGARARWFVVAAAAAVPLLTVLILSADYRRIRILSFLNP